MCFASSVAARRIRESRLQGVSTESLDMVIVNEVLILQLDALTSFRIPDVTLDAQHHSGEHFAREAVRTLTNSWHVRVSARESETMSQLVIAVVPIALGYVVCAAGKLFEAATWSQVRRIVLELFQRKAVDHPLLRGRRNVST